MQSLAWSRKAVAARAPKAILWIFVIYFLATLADIGGIITQIYRQESPINPIAFGIAAALIVPFTRGIRGFTYLHVGWAYVLIYSVMGLLGPYREVDVADYYFWQLTVKLWISVVGIPWLAARVVDKDRLPMLVKWSTLITALGALFAMLQVVYPAPFRAILAEPGRGAGFWVNPNHCGLVCGIMIFPTLLYPFRSKLVNLAVRTILVAGVVATLSRSGLVDLAVGAIVYGVTMKRLRTIATIGVVAVVFVLVTQVAVNQIGSVSERLHSRVDRLQAMLRGEIAESAMSRTDYWKIAYAAVEKEWLIGRGHGSMTYIVKLGQGHGPHNYYLFIWGNSGLLALLAFLTLLCVLFSYGKRAGDPRARAVIWAMLAMIIFYAMVDHGFIAAQSMSPLLTIIALTGHYAQKQKTLRPTGPRAIQRPAA